LRLSTEPGDRAAAEQGVHEAYAAADLPAPRQIVWCAGPVELAKVWARSRGMAGDNVRPQLIDSVRRKAEAAVDRALALGVRVVLAGEPGLSRLPSFSGSIDEAVYRDSERARPRLRTRLASLLAVKRRPRLSFASSSFGFHAAPWLGALEYLHDACRLTRQTEALVGLWRVAKNASWILPHEHVCWLAQRHDLLQHDPAGRLHSAKGPALRYRDGWAAYAWKGVLVPSWLIERPEFISVRTISAAHDPQIRRCMIDILTPEKFISQGGAYRVSQDETGILWRQRWRWEAWAAVEVINGTPEKDGSRRHYYLQVPPTVRSAREAVAWTYGLPEQRYRPAVRT
jgi:hypothetical protein